jgi:hypothetical protein
MESGECHPIEILGTFSNFGKYIYIINIFIHIYILLPII